MPLLGSGKSSTLLIAAIALSTIGFSPDELRVLVFGKANAEDLQGKLSKLVGRWRQCASTLRSVGFGLLRQERDRKKINVSGYKYKQIAQDLHYLSKGDRKGSLAEEQICTESDFLTLVDLVRLTNQPALPETVQAVAQQHEIELAEFHQVATAIDNCLTVGEDLAREEGIIDFTDMVWLPVRWQLHTRFLVWCYPYLFVDECQDLNQAQSRWRSCWRDRQKGTPESPVGFCLWAIRFRPSWALPVPMATAIATLSIRQRQLSCHYLPAIGAHDLI